MKLRIAHLTFDLDPEVDDWLLENMFGVDYLTQLTPEGAIREIQEFLDAPNRTNFLGGEALLTTWIIELGGGSK